MGWGEQDNNSENTQDTSEGRSPGRERKTRGLPGMLANDLVSQIMAELERQTGVQNQLQSQHLDSIAGGGKGLGAKWYDPVVGVGTGLLGRLADAIGMAVPGIGQLNATSRAMGGPSAGQFLGDTLETGILEALEGISPVQPAFRQTAPAPAAAQAVPTEDPTMGVKAIAMKLLENQGGEGVLEQLFNRRKPRSWEDYVRERMKA